MIRLYLVTWARSGAQIVNPVVDGVETIGLPASCTVVAAPAQKDGSPSKSHFVVLVEAATDYPWTTLASISVAKLLPEINYTLALTKQQESAIQRQLDDYGLTLPVGVSAASAFETVAKQVHPDAKIADRLKGIVRTLSPSGTFTDDFTEASTDTNLESHTPSGGTAWTRVDGAAGGAVVQASSDTLRVRSTTTTAYTCDDQGTADHYTQARNKTLSSGRSNSYVCVRLVDKDNFLGWRLAGSGATGSRLSKCVAGTVTDLVTFQGVDEAVYRVEVSGSDAEIFEDGVSKGTGTYSENTTETSQGVRSGDSSADPWIDDFEAGALSSGTIVAVPKASLILTGHVPTVVTTANITVSVPKGSLILTGYVPSVAVSSGTTIFVPKASLILTGYAPTIVTTNNKFISVPVGTLILTGYAPIVIGGEVTTKGGRGWTESERRLNERLRRLALQQAFIEDDEEALAILLASIIRR